MYTVLLNSNDEGLSYESFQDKFLEICHDHKETDRALAFAFILYDFENAQISKVLKDSDYWLSLNNISGEYLTVFSFHYKPKSEKPGWGSSRKKGPMDLVFMTTAPTFDNPSKDTNRLLETYFGKGINIKYPAVAFFQVHDNKVIDYVLIQLDSDLIEEAFLELKLYIKIAAETLKKITKENKSNSKEIFDLVEGNVKAARKHILLKRGIKKVTSIAELASTVVGLGG